MAEPIPTLYLDVSEIVVERSNTGIQRVVRRLVREGRSYDGTPECHLVPVVSVAGGLRRLNAAGHTALETAAMPARTPAAQATQRPATQNPVESGLAKRIMRKFPGLYETVRFRFLERRMKGLYENRTVKLVKHDVYVVLDSFWLRSSAVRTAERLCRRKRAVVAVVYDVISLNHPEYFSSELPKTFRAGLLRMARAGVSFISISRTAAADVQRTLGELIHNPVGYFQLGYDLMAPGPQGASNAWPAGLWNGDPTFLMVGTFEPRKNHVTVLDAFELMWKDGFTGKLLFIGRQGWGTDALLARLEVHPELGRHLFILHQASDTALKEAYSKATAAIVASHAEGFGLPLAESLSHHLPVLASDITVFREVGGELCLYFDQNSPASLTSAVHRILGEIDAWRAQAAFFKGIDWRGSVHQFVAEILRLAEQQRSSPSAPRSISSRV